MLFNTGFNVYAKNINPTDINRKKLLVEIFPSIGKIIMTFHNMEQEIKDLKFHKTASSIFENNIKANTHLVLLCIMKRQLLV